VLDAKNRILTRVSTGAVRNAHRSIFRKSTSARTNVAVPPYSCNCAGPKHPNIALPYSKHVTASAWINYTRTLLLYRPSNRAWHLMLLNAAVALLIRLSKMVAGLLFALFITNPKYLNSATFSSFKLLHLKSTCMLIYMALVFPTFILRPFKSQNVSNALIICYRPSALWDIKTASSAKARKNIYKVAISKIKRFTGSILCLSKYSSRYGYTWSNNIQNNFGEASSPYFTPILALKHVYLSPAIHTFPLFSMYIFLII
jgi:hypothetical protein